MKKMIITTLLLCTGLCSYAADLNIAVVDINKVVQQSPKMAKIQKSIDHDFADRHTAIMKKVQIANEKNDELVKNSSILTQEKKEGLIKELTALQSEIDSLQKSFQKDYETRRNNDFQAFFKQVNAVTQKLAAERHFDLILSSAATPFAGEKLDVTTELSKRVNEKVK